MMRGRHHTTTTQQNNNNMHTNSNNINTSGGRELQGRDRCENELSRSGSFRSLTSSDKIKKFTSLQTLLDNAVGSCSDVEKVNFRYLHEVITEIIRYLGHARNGVSKKHLQQQSNGPKNKRSDTNLPLIRRIEATESFIQELASTVKRINSDIRNNVSAGGGNGPVSVVSQSSIEYHTKDVNDAISRLSSKLQNIDSKFSDYATKDCVRESISEHSMTPEYVKSIITESITSCNCDADVCRRNEKMESLHDLVRNDVQFFEERIKMIAQKNQEMEERLRQKADASALEYKCDRREMETMTEEARSINNSLHSEIHQVKETVRLTSDSVTNIRKKNDEFSVHQKKFGGIIRRFETDVEEARNSIQYLKNSTKAHDEAKSNSEEAMDQIRIIQTNIEQKQKHFQLALEDLSDEYKRNDLRFANLANDIKTLREQKADEVIINEALAAKAEKKNSVSAIKLNEFESDIDQRLHNLAQKIDGNENNTKRWMGDIMDQLEKALCMKKNELKDIKTYIDQSIRQIGNNNNNNNNDDGNSNNDNNNNNNGHNNNNNTTSQKAQTNQPGTSGQNNQQCANNGHTCSKRTKTCNHANQTDSPPPARKASEPKLSKKKSSHKSLPAVTARCSSADCVACDCETKKVEAPKSEAPWSTGGGWLKILIYLVFSHIISMFLVSKLGSASAP